MSPEGLVLVSDVRRDRLVAYTKRSGAYRLPMRQASAVYTDSDTCGAQTLT